MLSFDGLSELDVSLCQAIVTNYNTERASAGFQPVDHTCAVMDLAACHLYAYPLDLRAMSHGDPFDVAHDIVGIARHLDRSTGKLSGCFCPRFILVVPAEDDLVEAA